MAAWVLSSIFGSGLTRIFAASTMNAMLDSASFTDPAEIGAVTQCSCPAAEAALLYRPEW